MFLLVPDFRRLQGGDALRPRRQCNRGLYATFKDATGKAFGAEIFDAAKEEGKINEVSYMFPKPGATDPSAKVSFVTKVGDLGCGVGYYK